MTKHPARLWLVALLLGWAFNFLFWKKPVGVNFAIFLGVCLLGGLALLISTGFKPARKSLLLALPAIFFSLVSFTRQEPLTHWLALAGALLALGLLATSYLGGRWAQYSLLDYIYRLGALGGGLMINPVLFQGEVRKEQAAPKGSRLSLLVKPVLRGFAIALPILALFTYLLASADYVFNKQVGDFFSHFNGQEIFEILLQIGLIGMFAYLLAGVFLQAANHSQDKKLIGEEKPVIARFLGFIETSVVLGSVSALLLLFVVIQFQYFFGGQENIGVEGFSYSQYARRGFNELVIVAFLSLLLTLGLNTISRRDSERQSRIYSGLSTALLVLTMVILVSAYQRLWLAIGWHGFSRLRLYPLVFMVWVGILFAAVVGLEIARRERYFAFAALIASLGFVASLAIINVDASIVRVNVDRARQGKHFNVPHLADLSNDAVPPLVTEFHDETLAQEVHEGIGAALACFRYKLKNTPDNTRDWRSWDLSEYQARAAMFNIRAELRDYGSNDNYWPVRVFTPSGIEYRCEDDGGD